MDYKNAMEIKTKEQFDRLIQPLDDPGRRRLREEVFSDNSKRKVHVWRGYHLSDKERYEACVDAMVVPQIEYMEFDNWIEAAIYICNTELQREDLSHEYKKYLVGQSFNYLKRSRREDNLSDAKYCVASEVAAKRYLASGTVIKYSVFAEAVDVIFDQSREFARSILSGEIRISHENMIELSRLKPDEIRAVAKSAGEENLERISLSYIRNEVKWSHVQQRAPSSRRERRERKIAEKPAIRQMPEYDPDSEVNSLCMTIDSWISSIQRVDNSENLSKITTKASLRLMKKLSFLEHTINNIQDTLVERTGI
ncbi:MAG: hypothetical protein IJ526_12040 [Lachnospiraceae bacterium]|nr:hypothetical protein [Lachnospiraceae bacterium]